MEQVSKFPATSLQKKSESKCVIYPPNRHTWKHWIPSNAWTVWKKSTHQTCVQYMCVEYTRTDLDSLGSSSNNPRESNRGGRYRSIPFKEKTQSWASKTYTEI